VNSSSFVVLRAVGYLNCSRAAACKNRLSGLVLYIRIRKTIAAPMLPSKAVESPYHLCLVPVMAGVLPSKITQNF
jgi:hypothetical protein